MIVRITEDDFDVSHELAQLRASHPGTGAVVAFVGTVRDMNHGDVVNAMTLEHYPGMTEQVIASIVAQAVARWRLLNATVVHRIGPLQPQDQIVLVAVASTHRGAAFDACEFIMDYLKTEAPFWKKEQTPTGSRWISARVTDNTARDQWLGTPDVPAKPKESL